MEGVSEIPNHKSQELRFQVSGKKKTKAETLVFGAWNLRFCNAPLLQHSAALGKDP